MLSSELAWCDIGKGKSLEKKFAPLAHMDFPLWDSYLREFFEKSPKKTLAPILSHSLPKRFVDTLIEKYFPHFKDVYVGTLSRFDRESIAKLLGNGIGLTLLERRPGDEFVTA